MSNEHALARTHKDIVRDRLPKLMEAMPQTMQARFRQAAIAAAMNPSLSNCTTESIIAALFACARLEIVPDPTTRQAYIIPYGGKATLVLGYPGMIQLAYEACPGIRIQSGVVYEEDEFTYVGGADGELKITKPHWLKEPTRRPDDDHILFSWCAFRLPGADRSTVITVPRYKLNEKRAVALKKKRSSAASPYETNFPEMCEKAAIRSAHRFWGVAAVGSAAQRLREAIAVDESEDDLPPMPEENKDLAEIVEGEFAPGNKPE
jgi:recombination protein RecT